MGISPQIRRVNEVGRSCLTVSFYVTARGADKVSMMSNSPDKRNEWRAIFYVQARVAILFVPVVASLLIIAALAGNERKSVPSMIDPTVTGSVR